MHLTAALNASSLYAYLAAVSNEVSHLQRLRCTIFATSACKSVAVHQQLWVWLGCRQVRCSLAGREWSQRRLIKLDSAVFRASGQCALQGMLLATGFYYPVER